MVKDLREKFREGLIQVAHILGTYPTKVTKEEYKNVCEANNIESINLNDLGGFTKVRDQLRAEGQLKGAIKLCTDINDEKFMGARRDVCIFLYDYIRNHNFIPNMREAKSSISKNIKEYFGTMEDFYEETEKLFPDVKDYVFNEREFLASEYKANLQEVIKKGKRFLITSAVSGKAVDEAFYRSMKTYAKENKTVVLILPLATPNRDSLSQCDLDPKLKDFWVVSDQQVINNNLRIWDIKVNPKQIKSLTGLARAVAPLNASIIVGGTKQAIEYIPTQKKRIPHMLASTGCCTVNDYDTVGLMTNKANKLVELMHKIGGLIIEKENDFIYHCRNIEAGVKGEFIDLGKMYSVNGVKTVKNNVMIMGDLHVPKHNVELVKKHLELIPQLKVSTVVLHDAINVGSVTHHNEGKICLKALQALRGENTIEGEAKALKIVLDDICKVTKNVVIPFSNHPEHLNRYLEEGRFINDYPNFYISLDLAKAYMDGKNVLQYLMENKFGLKARNIKWLNEDEGYEIYGVQAGLHGSEKVSGMRAGISTFSRAFKKAVIGHKHTPSLSNNVFVVGITCEEDQGYNKNLGAWMNTSAILYPNNTIQLINFIKVDNEYKCRL